MRAFYSRATAFQTALLAAAVVALTGCGGSTDPDLDTGIDYSGSPLQRTVDLLLCATPGDDTNPNPFFEPNPLGQLEFAWVPVDGATTYRFYQDPDGDSDADGEPEFVQVGADIDASSPIVYDCDGENVEWFETVVPVSPHLFDWQNALFMFEACDASGCEEVGRQSLANLSAQYILPVSGGNAFAYAESGNRLAVGFAAEQVALLCEEDELVEVAEPDGTNPCEYDDDLNVPDENGDPFDPLSLGLVRESFFNAGSVRVYTIENGIAELETTLIAPNPDDNDGFGIALDLSDDGSLLAVAAFGEASSATGINGDQDNNDAPRAGAVYLFERALDDQEYVWENRAYLKASNTEGDPDVDDAVIEGDQFGTVLALSGDGLTLAVAAWGEDSNAMGVDGDDQDNSVSNSGAVYVFRNVSGTWGQEAYIKASNPDVEDVFGASMAITTTGDRLAIGSVRESSAARGIDGDPFNNAAPNSGAVYIFDRSGSAWSQQAYIKAAQADATDEFGSSVALSGTGDVLAVGAPQEDSGARGVGGSQVENVALDYNTGAAYVFEYTNNAWAQSEFFKASNGDPVDEMGFAVALNRSGTKLLATSIREGGRSQGVNGSQALDDFVASGAGYLFVREGNSWSQKAYLKSPSNSPSILFGWDAEFAEDGDRLGVSAFNLSTTYIF